MTNTYNTLNPLGSTSAKDLSDNASNFDEGMNSLSPSFYDRFMRRRETWAGMEKLVNDFLEAMGFEATHLVYVDGVPLQVDRPTQLIDRAPSVYKVKQPASFPVNLTGTWATDQLLLVDVGDASLRQALAGPGGASMVGWLGDFSGAALLTQAQKNTQYRHIEDFPPLPANTWLQRAITGTPAGGVLHLGAGPYIGNYTESRNDITLLGVGPAPIPNGDRSELTAGTGTIIQGFTKFTGSGIRLLNIGWDNGGNVTASLNGGVEKDCLVVSNVGLSLIPNSNNHVINCTTLAKVGAATAHSCLLENFAYGSVQNVVAFGGFVGVVCKLQDCFIDNISGRKNLQSGIQLKSSSYALFARNTLGALYADDEGLSVANSVGIFIYAESGQLQGVKGGDLSTRGFSTGVGATQLTGQVINDLTINSISCENPIDMGFSAFGGMVNVSIGCIQVVKPLSAKSIFINDDVLGISIGSIMAVSPGADLNDSVRLGGVFDIGILITSINYSPATTTGVTVIPPVSSVTSWSITSYRARLLMNSGAGSNYLNGWTTGMSSPATCRLQGRRAFLNFCVVPPASRAGAEGFYMVNTGLHPLKPEIIPCIGVTNGTTLAVSIMAQIGTDGVVSFPYLSNPTAFPTGVLYVIGMASWAIS